MIAAVAVVVLVIAIGVWTVDRGRTHPGSGISLLLPRLAAVALLLSLSLGIDPAALFHAPARPRVAFVIDNTLSMGIRDGSGNTRWQNASRTARKLAGRHGIRGSIAPLVPDTSGHAVGDSLVRPGRWTDLARGIELAARDRPDAIVLLSDGDHNLGRSPVVAAAGVGIPVHTIGFGPSSRADSMALGDIGYPDEVGSGEAFAVRAAVRGLNGPGLLTLNEHDRAIRRQPLKSGTVMAEFAVTAGERGLHRYVLTLSRDGVARDSRPFPVMVSQRRTTVAWVGCTVDWNLRFFAQAVSCDPGIALHVFQRRGHEWISSAAGGAGRSATALDSAGRYDVVVISGFDAAQSADEMRRLIEGTVLKRGGGVLVIGDAGQAALPWLPLRPQGPRQQIDGVVQLSEGWQRSVAFPIGDTLAGSRLRRGPGFTLPGPFAPGDSSIVLATLSTRSHGRVPWWAWRFAGRSRVMQFASPDLWRWRLALAGAFRDTIVYDQLMINATRWLAGSEQGAFTLAPERGLFFDNEPVAFRAQWRGWDDTSAAGLRWNVALSGTNGFHRSLTLSDWGAGAYAVTVGNLPPGAYSYNGSAEFSGRMLDRQRGILYVEPGIDETRDVTQNRELLREIATVSGGSYRDADSLPPDRSWPDRFPVNTDRRPAGGSIPVTALLAIALLFAEWTLRRRNGLK